MARSEVVQVDGQRRPIGLRGRMVQVCDECGRKFDLASDDDAAEWFYGHDCEGD